MPDFSVVPSPSPASYAPPNMAGTLMNFLSNTIGGLPEDYQRAQLNRQAIQQRQQQIDLANAFKQGLPTDPQTGQPDYRKIAQILAQKGDVADALKVLPAGGVPMSPLLSGGTAAPGQGAPTTPAPATTTPTQAQPIAPPVKLPPTAGADTIAGLTASAVPDQTKAATVAKNIARAVGVDPDAALTAEQDARAQKLLQGYAARTGTKGPADLLPTIDTAAGRYGLDPSLLTRQLATESGFQANAKSPAGAEGVAQFMPGTAKRYGVDVADASSSITGAAHYDADLLKKFQGNQGLAIAGYNWGEGNVQKWLDAGADPNKMPAETRNYVKAITGQGIEAWTGNAAANATPNAPTAQAFGDIPPARGGPVPGAIERPTPQPAAPLPNAAVAAPAATAAPVQPAAVAPAAPVAPAAQPPQQQPINQVPLPKGFTDPQQAIMALRQEKVRLAGQANPYNQTAIKAQIDALDDWATQIEASTKPLSVSATSTIIDPRTGKVLYQGPMAAAFGNQEAAATLDADAQRYRQTGTLPPNMGRGMQGQQLAAAIRTRAVEQEEAAGGDAAQWPQRWAQFKKQGGYIGQVDNFVKGIQSGEIPPNAVPNNIKGPVISGLEDAGFNYSKAQIEWTRAQKQIQALNGPQMTRFVGLASSVTNTIDEVKQLGEQMQLSGIPALNRIKLGAYIQAEGNSEKGQLAARYIGAINTLKEEFANLAQGGYAPTEAVWGLANRQINENYGVKELAASLDEVQRLIKYRIQGIPGLSDLGAGAANRYTGAGGQSAAPAEAPGEKNWTTLPNGVRIRQVQ